MIIGGRWNYGLELRRKELVQSGLAVKGGATISGCNIGMHSLMQAVVFGNF